MNRLDVTVAGYVHTLDLGESVSNPVLLRGLRAVVVEHVLPGSLGRRMLVGSLDRDGNGRLMFTGHPVDGSRDEVVLTILGSGDDLVGGRTVYPYTLVGSRSERMSVTAR